MRWAVGMTMRSRRETVHVRHPFRIKGIDRRLALSFPCFRRVATMIMLPGAPPQRSAMEMVSIIPADLSDARRIDASTAHE
jgi:hypothetical protein